MRSRGWSARRYLGARARFGVKLGLEPMRALVAELGHPERAFGALLVAGTNGKGSVSAYVDAALRASGLRVGRYTSPHLVRLNERIAVDGRELGDAELRRAVRRVRDAAQALVERGRLRAHPTHFEVLTAAAFEHFRRAGVDWAVLEAGLGARLDATNVCEPLASAIVTVDWDHQEHLGRSLAAIAREKAGVLRAGRVTVVGALGVQARAAVAARAAQVGARLWSCDEGVHVEPQGERLDLRTPRGSYAGLRPLPGRHQQGNLLVAVCLLEAAAEAGVPVDFERLAGATAATRWPGRLQWVPGRPPLLLDGAHNAQGARALAAELRARRPFVLVFGAMQDKDLAGLMRPLLPLAEAVVLTRPPLPRAASLGRLAASAAGLGRRVRRAPTPARALALARRLAGPAGTVVVAGSLYLVGAVLKLVERGGRRA